MKEFLDRIGLTKLCELIQTKIDEMVQNITSNTTEIEGLDSRVESIENAGYVTGETADGKYLPINNPAFTGELKNQDENFPFKINVSGTLETGTGEITLGDIGSLDDTKPSVSTTIVTDSAAEVGQQVVSKVDVRTRINKYISMCSTDQLQFIQWVLDNAPYLQIDADGRGAFIRTRTDVIFTNDFESHVVSDDNTVIVGGIKTPVGPHDAANKQYVDDAIAAGGGGATGDFLPKNNPQFTGKLTSENSVLDIQENAIFGSTYIIATFHGSTGTTVINDGVITEGDLIFCSDDPTADSPTVGLSFGCISANRTESGIDLEFLDVSRSSYDKKYKGLLNIRMARPGTDSDLVILKNVGEPVEDTDAANKAYVDAHAGGGVKATDEYEKVIGGTTVQASSGVDHGGYTELNIISEKIPEFDGPGELQINVNGDADGTNWGFNVKIDFNGYVSLLSGFAFEGNCTAFDSSTQCSGYMSLNVQSGSNYVRLYVPKFVRIDSATETKFTAFTLKRAYGTIRKVITPV